MPARETSDDWGKVPGPANKKVTRDQERDQPEIEAIHEDKYARKIELEHEARKHQEVQILRTRICLMMIESMVNSLVYSGRE